MRQRRQSRYLTTSTAVVSTPDTHFGPPLPFSSAAGSCRALVGCVPSRFACRAAARDGALPPTPLSSPPIAPTLTLPGAWPRPAWSGLRLSLQRPRTVAGGKRSPTNAARECSALLLGRHLHSCRPRSVPAAVWRLGPAFREWPVGGAAACPLHRFAAAPHCASPPPPRASPAVAARANAPAGWCGVNALLCLPPRRFTLLATVGPATLTAT